jgi:Tfp pilus assembly protein PilF
MMLLLLTWVTTALAATTQSPACPTGRASTAVQQDTWVEPHPADVVVKQVVKSITALGYRFTDTTGPLVTVSSFSWPSSTAFTLWRGLVYPGARLAIAVEPTGPWTRIRLETRLVCETDQRPPAGHPQDVDFQRFVLDQTHYAVQWAISSPLHNLKVRVFAESCAPLGEGDLKIDVCRQMAKAQPRNPDALRQYVLALARFYRARDAWKPLGELFALEGERASTYREVGTAMLDAGQFDDARKLFARATELWSTDPIMAYRLGRAQLGLHRFEPAADALAVAVGLDSTLADGHTYAAVAATALGQSDEARQHCATATRYLETGLADRVADMDAWLGLAFCASIFARHREAVSYFSRAFVISASRARETPELVEQIIASHALVGDQPPAPVPQRQ